MKSFFITIFLLYSSTLAFAQAQYEEIYYTWNSISATSQTLVNENAYINQNSSLTNFTLPITAGIGDHYIIVGRGTGGWKLNQNSSQTIYFGLKNTTTGTSGNLASTNNRDAVEILCVSSNEFEIINSQGNITIT